MFAPANRSTHFAFHRTTSFADEKRASLPTVRPSLFSKTKFYPTKVSPISPPREKSTFEIRNATQLLYIHTHAHKDEFYEASERRREVAISIGFVDRRHLLLDIFPRHLREQTPRGIRFAGENRSRTRFQGTRIQRKRIRREKLLQKRKEERKRKSLLLLLLDRSIDKIENARGLLPAFNE